MANLGPGSCSLVTGGRGFVGAWLARGLLERGGRVVSFDVEDDPSRRSGLELVGVDGEVAETRGDLRDADAVTRALADGVDSVFHLAAQTIVGTAAGAPAETFDVNVRGTWTLLEACREHGVERVVVASSDKAYGAHEELPYRESFALQPTAPYEASKSAADLITRSYWPSYGLPVAVTRFANIYGGGDLNFSRLIPEAASAAIDGRAPVIRSDGSPVRDFLYVEDAVGAYIAIAEALERDEVRGQAFNAGGERPYTVGEVVELIARLSGSGVEPDVRGVGNPEGEIDRQFVDATKIREVVGWTPQVSLEEGLRRTIEWYREHPEARAAAPG
ncbi:MAG: NAD-dependent epimerase/dehydratase family protein [Solirubrobacterales bacterium]